MATLVVKLSALVLRTLAKPLSSRFQAYVMEHPRAREHAINMAQRLHRAEVWITRAADGKTGRAFVGDMTEEKSVELASKLASEGFVFGVGLLVVAFEYERLRQRELAKRDLEEAERKALLDRTRDERARLIKEHREQMDLIQVLLARVNSLETDLHQLLDVTMKAKMPPKVLAQADSILKRWQPAVEHKMDGAQ